MRSNDLYLAVLPLIHLTPVHPIGFGLTEQVLTLFPDKNLATEFLPEQVESFIATFKNRVGYLTGGNVEGYDVHPETTEDGLVIVRVTQRVTK